MNNHTGPSIMEQFSKCPKLSDRVEDDLFSRLDDELIVSHILSRLPLVEAVRSSVLSHRWKMLWTASIGPILIFPFSSDRFSDPLKITEQDVLKFTHLLSRGITNVLDMYDKPTLDELNICFDFQSNSSHIIHSWVKSSFGKGVTRLKLDFSPWRPYGTKNNYTFPRICKLSAWQYMCTELHQPVNCAGMYNLRYVCLKYIDVESEVINFMLSNCPSLECLSVWNSKIIEKLTVSTESAKLQRLEFVECGYTEIKISSPYLLSLHYDRQRGGHRQILYFEHVLNLSELTIGSGYCGTFIKHVSLLLPGFFYQLKKLTLDMNRQVIRESIMFRLDFHGSLKLEQLEISLVACIDSCLLWPIILIKVAPFLHTFSVKLFTMRTEKERTEAWHDTYRTNLRNAVKQVRNQSLTSIEMEGFRGCPMEIELALHLLGISQSLEQFVVKPFLPRGQEILPSQDDALSSLRKLAHQFSSWLPPSAKLVVL